MSDSRGNHNGPMPPGGTPPPFEILEHTADIGLRARGRSLEELFENAAHGLGEILDVDRPGQAHLAVPVLLGAADIEALLVDWMNEMIVLTEEGRSCLGGVHVHVVNEEGLQGQVDLVECEPAPEGTELKAATYHQLSVRQAEDGWEATVYFDV